MQKWLNIFDEINIVDYDENDYYIFRMVKKKVIMFYIKNIDNKITENLVENPQEIIDKYNIFDGKKIGVDLKSFSSNCSLIDYEEIRKTILGMYKVSNLKKFILRKEIKYKFLEKYLNLLDCSLYLEEIFDNTILITIKDNLGDIHIIKAENIFNNLYSLEILINEQQIDYYDTNSITSFR